ncbi:MAG TPA: hypothetical protein VMK65_11450 [Longimicrobiales bacterium]|nr:hypothetical protein [Longimicrobiales bacterium]
MDIDASSASGEVENEEAAAPSAGGAARGPLLHIPELLTISYETLGLGERAAALLQARVAGKSAAESARSREELESGPASQYHRHVVRAAEQAGFVDAEAAAAWKQALEEGKALRDPRVQAFLFGWHERAMEILADLEAGKGDEPALAKWFLSGLKP